MSTKLSYPKSIWYIFGNELCERFSYHGLKAILVLFFTTIQKYDSDTSTIIYHMFLVCAYLSPLFGAIIADSYWGKYKTIYILSIVHVIGNIVVAVASFITSVNIHVLRIFTIIGLLLTSIGAGGIKPCISSFGGDQFVLPGQEDQLRKFFSIFYFSVNVGALLSTFITPELRKSVQCFGQDSCFPLAFGVPAILMLISIVFFISGKGLYKIKKPVSSVIITSIRCMFHALKNKITSPSNEMKRKDWLEYADDKYNKHEIHELRSALDVMYLLIPVPVFYMLFDQQGSRWILQGILMNGRIDLLNWTMKPDQMHLMNPLFILILIPLFNIVVYPILYKIGINSPLQKITVGGIFAALSFVCAAAVQYTIIVNTHDWFSFNVIKITQTFEETGKFFNILVLDMDNFRNFQELFLQYIKLICSSILNHSSNEFHLKIYNNIDCKVQISDLLIGNCSIEPLDVCDIHYSPVLNITDVLSIDIDPICQLKPSTLKQHILIFNRKTSSYFITYSNTKGIELRRLNKLKKLRSGNPNLRILHDDNLFSKIITLRDVYNKQSKINVRLSSNRNQNYELPVGSYNVYLDEEYITKVDFLPASVNYLLLHHNLNYTKAKLIILEKGKYIHILWQVPQIILITIAETMFVITLLEFSFTQAPLSMKSFVSAANLFTQAFGNLLIVVLSKIRLFENQGHEYLFYAILMVLSMIIFMMMGANYKYKYVTDNQTKE